MRLSESRTMLASAMPSVSIFGKANNAIKREQNDACISYAERESYYCLLYLETAGQSLGGFVMLQR